MQLLQCLNTYKIDKATLELALKSFIEQNQNLDTHLAENNAPPPSMAMVEDCKIFYKHLSGKWWSDD